VRGPVADPRPARRDSRIEAGALLVLVGLPFEARRLARHVGGGGLVRTVGLAASDLPRLAPALRALRPGALLVTGLAGGCAPDVAPGDLVVATAVGPATGGRWLTPDPALAARAGRALAAARLPHRSGLLLTVPAMVPSPAAKAECWRTHRALAVDMESARVLEWAAGAGLPALCVRAVADGPGESLPPALGRLLGPGGRVRPRALLAGAVRPAVIGAALRLWRRSGRALDHLGRFLAAFVAVEP
jgi:hypothetical protein